MEVYDPATVGGPPNTWELLGIFYIDNCFTHVIFDTVRLSLGNQVADIVCVTCRAKRFDDVDLETEPMGHRSKHWIVVTCSNWHLGQFLRNRSCNLSVVPIFKPSAKINPRYVKSAVRPQEAA